MILPLLNFLNYHTPEVMEAKKKKVKPEATDFDDSFDFEDGYNLNEVYN